MPQPKINIKNRKATFNYEILETFQAGIVLCGTEIKSIRLGKASLSDSYCFFQTGELWIRNMHVSAYAFGSYNNHEILRDRKLLLQKKELRKLERQVQNVGLTIIPLKLYINDSGLAKLSIALCQGKKRYDKRQTLKERDDKREMQRLMKH